MGVEIGTARLLNSTCKWENADVLSRHIAIISAQEDGGEEKPDLALMHGTVVRERYR